MSNRIGLVNARDVLVEQEKNVYWEVQHMAEQAFRRCCFKVIKVILNCCLQYLKWQTGAVKGLVARGNLVLAFTWDNGLLKQVKLLSRKGGVCKVKYKDHLKTLQTQEGKSYELKF